jgi:hypothetical protein
MKHIKKKYLYRIAVTAIEDLASKGQIKHEDHTNPSPEAKTFLADGEDKFAILQTEDGETVMAFVHKVGDEQYAIPEPDPILVYFNNAQSSFRLLNKSREKLFNRLKPIGDIKIFAGNALDEMYDFMTLSTSCAIFLFTAIEVTLNKSIPADHVYKRISPSGKIKEYSSDRIQRSLDMETKLKILSSVTGRDFSVAHPLQFMQIMKLKELRDSIIHTKKRSGKPDGFSYIFKDSLAFDYDASMHAVRDLINFYIQNHIEPCNCGRDF